MSGNSQVGWIVELVVKPGKMDAFRILVAEMVAATQENEAGTLTYDWHINENTNEVISIERYASSEAAMLHINTFAEKFSRRFFDLADQTRLLVYGHPNEALHLALINAGSTFTVPIEGFWR